MRLGRLIPAAVFAVLVAACSAAQPSPSVPSSADSPASVPPVAAAPTTAPTATERPTPAPVPEVEVPLVVVTGYTNARAEITLDELRTVGAIRPCEMDEYGPPLEAGSCEPIDQIVELVLADPAVIALLPPDRVVPTLKVLPVDGADIFGGPAARERPYPITGRMAGVEPHDPGEIRTLVSLGDSCPDRGVAHAALIEGRGWDWIFNGGTAEYTAIYPNPVPPGVVGNGFNIVEAVRTGNEGAVAELVSGADVTVDDFECPVVENFTVNDGVVFSIDPEVLPRLRDTYGVDVATLAANHLFDRGTPGFLETLDQFEAAGIPITGAGVDAEAALEAAYFDADGLTFAFVAFNEVPGSLEAGGGQPGVAWLRDENVQVAVGLARPQADVVICVPQWWGGGEYHAEFRGDMRRQQDVFFDAGCDHILGHGTHWSGPIQIDADETGVHRVTMVSHGNFLFGQSWSQETQEGVILELAFRGTELAQARMHPYIMLEQAQTNLTDPETDGLHILNRIYTSSGLAGPLLPAE